MKLLSAMFSALYFCATTGSSQTLLTPRQDKPGDSIVRKIYQFPNETWIENLVVRANGKILVTLISTPEVWEIDPFATPTTAELIYHFPDAISCAGIAEYAPDSFAVNVGNFSDKTFKYDVGSYSVWSIDMRSHWKGGWDKTHHGGRHHEKPKVHKIADVPSAKFLNGMTTLPGSPNMVLLADSAAGLIYRLDTVTGAYSVAIDDPALKPNTSAPVLLGVNGIHTRPGDDEFIYFTNTLMAPAFSRIPINPRTGAKKGPDEVVVESVAALGGGPDDFCFDRTGKAAYIADGALYGLLKVAVASGETEVVVGGTPKSRVVGQTACNFGRTKEDVEKGTLYITTNGGIEAPPPRGIFGGCVFALDTTEL